MTPPDVDTPESIEDVCQRHFTNELNLAEQALLVPAWFLDLDFAHVVEKKSQIEALETLDRSLRKSLMAVHTLHKDLDRSIEWKVAENIEADDPVFRFQTFTDISDDEKRMPIQTYDNLKLLIGTALAAFLGQSADSAGLPSLPHHPTKSAAIAARARLSNLKMLDMNAQSKANESWQKALMVKRCRYLWHTGTGSAAPKAYSGKFAGFLDEMVSALGKRGEWTDSESVMKAWSHRAKHEGWFY